MPKFSIEIEVPIKSDARVKQVEGIFDIAPGERSVTKIEVDMPYEDREWSVGLVMAPSGAGKTTIARHLWPDKIISGFDWDRDKAVVSEFPSKIGIQAITEYLSSVGFSSPPSWLRPFHALSNGEQFRVTLARAMAEENDLFVIDEFTSVVDRTVARVGSYAVAKAVRRSGKRMVALSCHHDVVEWLQPDWIYEPAGNLFTWRSLRRRPAVDITICRVDPKAWGIFKKHHYLSSDIHPGAHCYVASWEGNPVAFIGMLHFPHPRRCAWKGTRAIVLPDYQGAGFGSFLFDYIAGVYRATGLPVTGLTSSPQMIRHVLQSSQWIVTRKPSIMEDNRRQRQRHTERARTVPVGKFGDNRRRTCSFEYVGPINYEDALGFGLPVRYSAS